MKNSNFDSGFEVLNYGAKMDKVMELIDTQRELEQDIEKYMEKSLMFDRFFKYYDELIKFDYTKMIEIFEDTKNSQFWDMTKNIITDVEQVIFQLQVAIG